MDTRHRCFLVLSLTYNFPHTHRKTEGTSVSLWGSVFNVNLFFYKHCAMNSVTLLSRTLGSTSFIQGVGKLFLGSCSLHCSREILRVAGGGCHRACLPCLLLSGEHLCLCCWNSWEDKSGPYCSILAPCCCFVFVFKSCLYHPAGKRSNRIQCYFLSFQ